MNEPRQIDRRIMGGLGGRGPMPTAELNHHRTTVRQDVHLGSVVTLPLGDGRAGEPAQVSLTVIDAHDSIEGFLGIRSFVVLSADDLQAQVIAHRAAADALRQELDFMTNTRSWKVTAPLRRLTGRGAGGQ